MKKCLLGLMVILNLPLGAQDSTVHWELQDGTVSVGRSLLLSLEIRGTDQVTLPQLQEEGLTITLIAGQPTRSTTSYSINGRTTTETRTGYQATWSLKASRPGRYALRGYRVGVAGRQEVLPEVTWTVLEPQNSKDFLLRQSLEPSRLVPGLEATYTLKWYLGETAQDPEFTLPLIDSGLFEWLEEDPPAGGDRVVLEYGTRTLEGEKSAEILDGRQFTVITFRLRLRALKAGALDLSGTVLNFQGASGYREYYDFFGDRKRQPVFQALSIPADPLQVRVQDFPIPGRPEPFSGLVGNLALAWTVTPGSYRVGESIPVSLKITGLLNGKDLDLDHMVRQAYQGTPFRISGGQASADGGREYFLRVASPGKHRLPGLKLNYFNPGTGTYGWAQAPGVDLDIEGGLSAGGPSPREEKTLGYRAPHYYPGEGTWPWYLLILLPLGGGCSLLASWWAGSGLRKRLLFRKTLKGLVLKTLAEMDPRAPKKDLLILGIQALQQWGKLLQNPETPELSSRWEEEKKVWDEAFYSRAEPSWSPQDRFRLWTQDILRRIK